MGLAAALQAGSPGAASLLDARPEARAQSQRLAPHVEPFGTHHAGMERASDCVLCRIALRGAAERPQPPLGLFVARSTRPIAAEVQPATSRPLYHGYHSRAPPAR